MGEPSAAVLRSLVDLRSLSSAVSKFIHAWDGLRSLHDSINSSMDSLSSQLDATAAPLPQLAHIRSPKAEAVESEMEYSSDADANAPSGEEGGSGEAAKPEDEPKPKPKGKNGGVSEIESICNSKSSGKRLRKYVVDRLHSGLSQMYDEIPAVFARAQENPGGLVLGCIGGFYKQGNRTFVETDPQTANRRAAILVLEFFLLSGCAGTPALLDPAQRQIANTAALGWKERMLHEGGISKAEAVDALGLLLLLASFGFPSQFTNDDIANLLMLSNPRKKVRVLRQSPILIRRLPGIIKDMAKDAKHLAAAELVIAFELQEKFPLLPLLSSCLDAIKREEATERKEGQFSVKSMSIASEERLSKLLNFLIDHDLYDEYARLKLDGVGSKLEKDVTNWLQKLNASGKPEETTLLERTESHSRSPQMLNATRKTDEGVPLEWTQTYLKPQNPNGKRKAEEIAPSKKFEAHSIPPQILNAKVKPEETAPMERIETTLKQPPNLNMKRKAEEYTSFKRMEHHPKPPPLLMDVASEIPASLNMWGPLSLGRSPSLEHPNSVPAPMNMQVNSGGLPSTSPLGVAYPGMDSRFPGLLTPPVIPTRNSQSGYPENGVPMGGGYLPPTVYQGSEYVTSGYPENGLPIGGGYTPPSGYHGSERYSWYRESRSAGVPIAHNAFGISHPSGGGAHEHAETYPEVGSLPVGRNRAHTPLPPGIGSRAPGSADRYNFADMV